MIIGLSGALSTVLKVFRVGATIEDATDGKIDPHLLGSRGSSTRLLNEFIVEPTFVVSQGVIDSTAFKNTIGLNLNMFTTLYANSFSVLVNVHGVKPAVAFNALSSTELDIGRINEWRGHLSKESSSEWVTNEIEKAEERVRLKDIMGSEVFHESDASAWADDIFVAHESSAKVANRSGKAEKEPPLISKNIDVTFTADGVTSTVPIIIRARIITVSGHELKSFMTVETDKHSIVNRWHKYRAGGITGAEFIFCTDLLEDYGKSLKSSGEALEALEKRRTAAFANNSATPIGFGRDYGALIVSSADKGLINTVIRGDIDNNSDKNKLLARTSSFNLTVINDEWEVIQVYTSNIKGVSTIEFGDIKPKDENAQLSDIFKNLTESSKIRL